jgi:hypothetical protein
MYSGHDLSDDVRFNRFRAAVTPVAIGLRFCKRFTPKLSFFAVAARCLLHWKLLQDIACDILPAIFPMPDGFSVPCDRFGAK